MRSSSTKEGSCSEPPRKKTRKGKHVALPDTEIDTNVCCVCFGLYTEDVSGADWIECACGHWLHEERAEECVVDAGGKESFATYVCNHLQLLSSSPCLTLSTGSFCVIHICVLIIWD